MGTAQDRAGPEPEGCRHLFRTVLLGSLTTAVWARLRPLAQKANVSPSVIASDNMQRAMNLIMPLRHPLVVTRGEVVQMLVEASDEILVGLNNVGTVHFARFDIVGGNLCMFSIYDGEFSGYIRDFIATIGSAFDKIMDFVKDPPPTPVGFHVDEFLAWVNARDALRLPEVPTDNSPHLVSLPRDTLVLLHRNPNVMLGVYRNYPGFSAAQVRNALSIGW